MLYTNGVIIVHRNNNTKEMEEMLTNISNHMDEVRNEVVKFEFTNEHGYPAYVMPENMSFTDLQDVLGAKVMLKAINEDEIVLNGEQVIEKEYTFEQEELHELANELIHNMDAKNKLISEKAISANKFAGQIKESDKKIEEIKVKHSTEKEIREYKTKVKLNFKDGYKYFIDINDDVTVHDRIKMSKDEMQIRIDHRFDAPVELGKKKKGSKTEEVDESPM